MNEMSTQSQRAQVTERPVDDRPAGHRDHGRTADIGQRHHAFGDASGGRDQYDRIGQSLLVREARRRAW